MKTLFRTRNLLSTLAVVLSLAGIVAYAQKEGASNKAGSVEISIKLHPPVNLSPEDEKALNEALAHFDKSLYRLIVLKDGQIDKDKSSGTLTLSKEMEAELTEAQKKHLSGYAPEFIPVGGMVFSASALDKQKADDSARLLQAIAPILSKYQKTKESNLVEPH